MHGGGGGGEKKEEKKKNGGGVGGLRNEHYIQHSRVTVYGRRKVCIAYYESVLGKLLYLDRRGSGGGGGEGER